MDLDFGIVRAAGEIRFVHRIFETMFDQSLEELAIDAGAILPNIPDAYTRKGPDLGAYKLARNCCPIGRGLENVNYPLYQGMEAVLAQPSVFCQRHGHNFFIISCKDAAVRISRMGPVHGSQFAPVSRIRSGFDELGPANFLIALRG